jgi:hypothetical protein
VKKHTVSVNVDRRYERHSIWSTLNRQ